jgi:YrbI family 3-deoxy-D-manno-octulosonate 8-phosphate phosphatase
MDVLAVIPAARSQNARSLGGRPLALQAIDQARATRRVTRIVAVTADAELARLIVDDGTEVVQPAASAGGDAPALLAAALARLECEEFAPLVAILLDPEFPFRTAEAIEGAIDLLCRCGADSLVAVYPLANAIWMQDELGAARPCAASPGQRRFIQSDVLSAVRVDAFSRTGELPTGQTVLYEVSMLSALRIEAGPDCVGAEFLQSRSRTDRPKALLGGIELLVFDFDGVMTDNRVLVFEDGREAVLCNRGDGLGLEMLRKAGVPMAVISKEINPVVGARCRKLKIPYLQGIEDKRAALANIAADRRVELAQVAYMGNDINDLECMQAVGLAIAPADSHPEARRAADLVTSAPGGFGAVREVCDLLLAARAP